MPCLARLAAVLTTLTLCTPLTAQTVYVIGAGDKFGFFDLSTRVYTQVSGSVAGASSAQGLAYNAATDTMYLDIRTGSTPQNLFSTIDRGTGVTTPVGSGSISVSGFTPADLPGLAFSPGGTLYTYLSGNSRLATVNTADGTFVEIGSNSGVLNNNPFIGRLAFAGTGGNTLYGTLNPTTNKGLYQFDTDTSVATFKGAGPAGNPTRDAATYTNLIAFGSGSALYGINGTELYQINTSNGALMDLGGISGDNLPSQFVAAVVAPVPEPATTLGLAAAGLGLFRLARRRAATPLPPPAA